MQKMLLDAKEMVLDDTKNGTRFNTKYENDF